MAEYIALNDSLEIARQECISNIMENNCGNIQLKSTNFEPNLNV